MISTISSSKNDEKQGYLRGVILEAGYSGEKFVSYLESVKSIYLTMNYIDTTI